jgi:hypothetical protein
MPAPGAGGVRTSLTGMVQGMMASARNTFRRKPNGGAPIPNLDRLIFFDCFSKLAHLRRPGQLIRSTRAPTKDRSIGKIMGGNPAFRGTRVPSTCSPSCALARTCGRRGSVAPRFRYHVIILWHRRLRRRSQRARLVWTQMAKLADEFLPKPRILHPWPSVRFAVSHPR